MPKERCHCMMCIAYSDDETFCHPDNLLDEVNLDLGQELSTVGIDESVEAGEDGSQNATHEPQGYGWYQAGHVHLNGLYILVHMHTSLLTLADWIIFPQAIWMTF